MALLQGEPKGLLDAMPDPMKPTLGEIGFIVALMVVLYVFLRGVLFTPLTQVMDDREADIDAGEGTKAQAAALVEQRQAEYAARLKELRAQAFAHKKGLADAASREKQSLLGEARAQAGLSRTEALSRLQAQQEAAKGELMAQVDALSESMVQHLLKQA